MTWFDYLWLEGEDGNIEHGLSQSDVEHVIENFIAENESRSSGRPVRFGYTPDGRYVAVVFEWIDDATVFPVTAYEVDE